MMLLVYAMINIYHIMCALINANDRENEVLMRVFEMISYEVSAEIKQIVKENMER